MNYTTEIDFLLVLDWKSKIAVSDSLVASRASVLSLQMAAFLLGPVINLRLWHDLHDSCPQNDFIGSPEP